MGAVEDQTTALRRAMAEVKRQGAPAPAAAPRGRQRVIAIGSGKGGVGKTNLSANLALALHLAGEKTCILDGDLGLSNVNIVLGELPKWNLFHVLKGEKKLEEIVFRTQWGPDLVAGASGFQELANLDDATRARFVESLGILRAYDNLVIDTGAGIGANVTAFLQAARQVLIVTTPEPTAVTDAYGLIKSLAAAGRTENINLVINRIPSVAEGRKVAERIRAIARQFLRLEVELLGMVHEDEAVVKAVYQRKPFLAMDPKCRASAGVRAIAERLRGKSAEDAGDEGALGAFLRRLFG